MFQTGRHACASTWSAWLQSLEKRDMVRGARCRRRQLWILIGQCWGEVNKSNESYTGLKTVILGVWLGHRSLASSWQPHFSQVSQRVAYIQTYIFHISAMLSRQGLLLVENVDGALALGGIDQQYQVGRVIVRTHVCILRLINYLKVTISCTRTLSHITSKLRPWQQWSSSKSMCLNGRRCSNYI